MASCFYETENIWDCFTHATFALPCPALLYIPYLTWTRCEMEGSVGADHILCMHNDLPSYGQSFEYPASVIRQASMLGIACPLHLQYIPYVKSSCLQYHRLLVSYEHCTPNIWLLLLTLFLLFWLWRETSYIESSSDIILPNTLQ